MHALGWLPSRLLPRAADRSGGRFQCDAFPFGLLCEMISSEVGGSASYCLLVSGLGFGGPHWNPLATTLLTEYIMGGFGDSSVWCRVRRCSLSFVVLSSVCVCMNPQQSPWFHSQDAAMVSRIARVVVCGGILDFPEEAFGDKVPPAAGVIAVGGGPQWVHCSQSLTSSRACVSTGADHRAAKRHRTGTR